MAAAASVMVAAAMMVVVMVVDLVCQDFRQRYGPTFFSLSADVSLAGSWFSRLRNHGRAHHASKPHGLPRAPRECSSQVAV